MKTAVMTEKQKIIIEEHPVPVPDKNELLIRVDYVGICGSDIHLYQTGTCGGKPVGGPCVLGHEAAGVVVGMGSGVDGFSIGDAVAVEPQIPCMRCEFCKSGRYNLCPKVQFYASPPALKGCFSEYITHPEAFCYKLPEGVGTLEGALLEPLSVGLHAVKRSGIEAGESAAVIGAGCIGLMVLLALQARGVRRIFVVDVVDNRLRLAEEMGNCRIIHAAKTDAVKLLQEQGGADVVFEAAGRPQTIRDAGLMVKRGGTITLIGYPVERKAEIYVNHLINHEVTIKTAFRYRNTYPYGIRLLKNGLPLKKAVSDIFEFEQVEEGIRRAMTQKDQVTKCVVRVNPDAG